MAAKDPLSFPDLRSKIGDNKRETDPTRHLPTVFKWHCVSIRCLPGPGLDTGITLCWWPEGTRSLTVAAADQVLMWPKCMCGGGEGLGQSLLFIRAQVMKDHKAQEKLGWAVILATIWGLLWCIVSRACQPLTKTAVSKKGSVLPKDPLLTLQASLPWPFPTLSSPSTFYKTSQSLAYS